MSQDQTKLAAQSSVRTPSVIRLPALVENSSLVKAQPYAVEKTSAPLRAAQELVRLQAACRHLRATHSCPGECVLSRQERLLREMENLEVS
jgi:hypothetical protein